MDRKIMMKSSIEKMELTNGEEVNLTLNFRALLDVRGKKEGRIQPIQ